MAGWGCGRLEVWQDGGVLNVNMLFTVLVFKKLI